MLGWLRPKQTSRQDFSQAVTGEVVSIRHGQVCEDDGAGFDLEILTVFSKQSGEQISCAQFSGDAGYGAAKTGQRVEMSYRKALDEADFGTPNKVESLRVLSLRLVKW